MNLGAISVISLAVAAIGGPGDVLADAVPPEGGGEPGMVEGGIDIGLVSLAVVVSFVALIAIAITVRPAWRGVILGGAVGVASLVVGLFFVVGGLFFFDWTGQHEVRWPAVAIGAIVLVGGLALAVRTARGAGRRSNPDR